MPAMRLLIICDDQPGESALEQTAALAQCLDREQFNISAVLLQSSAAGSAAQAAHSQTSAPSPQPPAPVPFSNRWPIDPRAVRRLRRLVLESQPAIVITVGELAWRCGGLAARLAGHERLVGVWPSVDFDYRGSIDACFRRSLARRCERVVLANDAECAAAIAHGWPAERIAVVPMAATPRERTMRREAVFAPLGIAAAAPVVGVVAPWLPRHRVKEAIWAFDLVRAVRGDARMIVAGGGPQRADLEAFRDSQHCRQAIHFVGRDELPAEWLAHCVVVWSPDPAPRVSHDTLVAAASAVPVVAVDTPAHRAFLADRQTGMLVPISVRPAAPQATLELLHDAPLRQRIGAAARQHMAERHAPESVAAAIGELLCRRD